MDEEKKKEVRYDLSGRYALTEAVRGIVNGYPHLTEGESVAFATLSETGGLALYPGGDGIIEKETRSVTGKVRQVCRYPFYVLFRAGGLTENRKAGAKEWLDGLARWLEQLTEFPELEGRRKLLGFAVLGPAYLYGVDDSHVETWAVALAARYENIYQK